MGRNISIRIRDKIISLHIEIEQLAKAGISKAIKLGSLLTELKGQLPHGGFTNYVLENFPFTARTARNYMRVFDNRHQLTESTTINEAYQLIAPKRKVVSVSKDFARAAIGFSCNPIELTQIRLGNGVSVLGDGIGKINDYCRLENAAHGRLGELINYHHYVFGTPEEISDGALEQAHAELPGRQFTKDVFRRASKIADKKHPWKPRNYDWSDMYNMAAIAVIFERGIHDPQAITDVINTKILKQ